MFCNSLYKDAIAIMDMFIETSSLQYYENNDDICDDGINMNGIFLVSRIIYYLLNKENHIVAVTTFSQISKNFGPSF